MNSEYYIGGSAQCSCIECFTNRVVSVLGDFISFYLAFNYRYTEAECPECGDNSCPRASFHGNICQKDS